MLSFFLNIDKLCVRLLSWDQKSNLEISQVLGLRRFLLGRRRLRGLKGVSLGPSKILLCCSLVVIHLITH